MQISRFRRNLKRGLNTTAHVGIIMLLICWRQNVDHQSQSVTRMDDGVLYTRHHSSHRCGAGRFPSAGVTCSASNKTASGKPRWAAPYVHLACARTVGIPIQEIDTRDLCMEYLHPTSRAAAAEAAEAVPFCNYGWGKCRSPFVCWRGQSSNESMRFAFLPSFLVQSPRSHRNEGFHPRA
jgi:hypothetical protein